MAVKREDYVSQLLATLADYGKSMDAEGALLVKGISDLIRKGLPVYAAVDTALKQRNYNEFVAKAITDSVYKMALHGYGIPTSIRVDATPQKTIKKALTTQAWTGDGMNLSDRLHGTGKAMRDAIVTTIQTSLNKQAGLEKLSMSLYDGYRSGKNVIKPAELPDYLERLNRQARKVAAGDKAALKEYEKALANVKSNIEKMAGRNRAGTPNTDLLVTYKNLAKEAEKLVQAAGKLNTEALDKAAWMAVQEKSRYHADRIARTEDARAWFDGFILETQEDELVFGYRWRLSKRHQYVPFDQCDVCAHMDVGYGPGVYPKNMVPSIPRHPHCMCYLEVVYWDEIDPNARFNSGGARKYIDGLTAKKKEALFGGNGVSSYEKGEDWQKLLRGWDGFKDPVSRLKSKDMERLQAADSPVSQYTFFGDKPLPAKVEMYQDIKLVQPVEMNPKLQPMTMEDVKAAVDTLPELLKEAVREIQLVDYRNPHDEYWEKTYKIKDFYSFAVGGQGRVVVFANQKALKAKGTLAAEQLAIARKESAQYLKEAALAHEAGHNLDRALGEEKGERISQSQEWHDIMRQDFLVSGRRYCSSYAARANSPIEDFADAVSQFVAAPEKFRKLYPHRAKWIEEVLRS